MSFFITFLLLQSLFATQLNAEPVHCLSCPGVGKPEDCRTTLLCAEGEICETQKYITTDGHVFFELGCRQVDICKSTNALVGTDELRARINNTRAYPLVGKRQLGNIAAYVCIECCDTPYCNDFLCGGHETALKCARCQNVASLDDCNHIEFCRPHESCYVSEVLSDRFELQYEAGCLAETRCNSILDKHGQGNLGMNLCSKCCRDSMCNKACASASPTPAQTTITATSNATTTATTLKMLPPSTPYNLEAIHCLSCPRVGKPEDCRITLLCAEGEICETQKYSTTDGHVFFELGCRQVDICKSTNALVGTDELRARINNTRAYPLVGKRQLGNIAAYVCIECCETPYCNNFLCGGHETALKCARCQNVASLDDCNHIEFCRPHESCYVSEVLSDRFELQYEAGCLAETRCNSILDKHGQGNLGMNLCSKCCRDSMCNKACASASPTPAQTTITATSNATTTATTLKIMPPSTPYNLGPPQSSPRVLTCGSCIHSASSLPCNQTMTCQPNEVCYVREGINEMFQYRHERGCMELSYCEELIREEVLGELGQNICFMCCDENLCNTNCSMATNPMTSIRHRRSAAKVGKAGDVS